MSDLINAGLYIFNPTVFARLPEKGSMNAVLPQLAADELLYHFESHGYWVKMTDVQTFRSAVGPHLGARPSAHCARWLARWLRALRPSVAGVNLYSPPRRLSCTAARLPSPPAHSSSAARPLCAAPWPGHLPLSAPSQR